MAILFESLSVWDISFRWAGYDPDKFIIRYPLCIKDNFRLLTEAILGGELFCETLILAKRPLDSKADPSYYIRTHLGDVYDCIGGIRYKKKLLKWAIISRDDFKEWCERRSIPLPEFWFPAGWQYEFEQPEFGTRAFWARHMEPDEPGGFAVRFDIPDTPYQDNDEQEATNSILEEPSSLRSNQKTKLVAQEIAIQMWKESPGRTIAEMMRDEIILKYSGASHYGESALRKWLSEVAPLEVKGKRGRPRNKPDEDS